MGSSKGRPRWTRPTPATAGGGSLHASRSSGSLHSNADGFAALHPQRFANEFRLDLRDPSFTESDRSAALSPHQPEGLAFEDRKAWETEPPPTPSTVSGS